MLVRNNDYYFYLGGLVSFTLFLSFSVLFFSFILQKNRTKHIQVSSSEYIAVNLNHVPTAPPVKTKKSKMIKEEKVEEKILETVDTPPKKVNTDISSLFGEVKTKKLKKRNKTKKSSVDDKFLKKIQKRIKTKDTKSVKSTTASSLIKNLKPTSKDIKVVGESTGVVDEYLAKIHAEIYSKFFPPAESVGRSAKVRLEIDEHGSLVSFRVITYSSDTLFDEAVDSCMNALSQFPVHKDKKAISLDIILTAKE